MVVIVGQGRGAQSKETAQEKPQVYYAARQVFDGKRMRKAVQRRTIDYFSDVVRYLEVCACVRARRPCRLIFCCPNAPVASGFVCCDPASRCAQCANFMGATPRHTGSDMAEKCADGRVLPPAREQFCQKRMQRMLILSLIGESLVPSTLPFDRLQCDRSSHQIAKMLTDSPPIAVLCCS